ncbi:hypothetical protein L2E82_44824 [Cichorium intybus]|uniref:Uncharacterized protein n=1 Tax=Cichorium intybus TaxID=13427 RepID=A0ACB8ZSL8_CICIN|nr:hypothetical protein L2E82_44824 [Cichorium intybus]
MYPDRPAFSKILSSPWPRMSGEARRKILLKFADIIDENADELATLEVIDGGKLFGPVRYFEVPISSETFRYFAGAADKIRGPTLKMSSSILAYTLREPIGVAGHIIHGNGPAYMFATKVAPALAAGCTMVIKPAEQTPLTVLFFAHLSKLICHVSKTKQRDDQYNRHLPVVENGEVIAILDIAKCLYDAIARMERAAQKGKAIAAAVEGVEKHWGTSASALGISPESTMVEKVMTPNPECANIDTPIVDALHTMHHGKFLHLPVVDREGIVVAIIDVLHISHAVVASVGSFGIDADAASTMMQNFWDSAMATSPADDDSDSRSESSFKLASEGIEIGKVIQYPLNVLLLQDASFNASIHKLVI